MSAGKPDSGPVNDLLCSLNITGLNMTRVIFWLIAITVVSFVLGFAILAISGGIAQGSENTISPFRHTAMFTPNTTTIPLEGATTATVRIVMGAGEMSLQGGAPAQTLVENTIFSKAPEWQPAVVQQINGTQKSVVITDRGHKGKEWFAVHSPNSWDLRLNDAVLLDLTVELGAGDSTLDLGSLNLRQLVVNNGAGETKIDLSRYHGATFRAQIHNGIGDLSLRIPKNSNTRISIQQGVGEIKNTGFEQHAEFYSTIGYDPALPGNEILIEQGVGDIRIETV